MEASNDRPRRVDLGFTGGQVLGVRLRDDVYQELRQALEGPSSSARWYELESEDSAVTIDLAQVVYVRLDTETSRVGF